MKKLLPVAALVVVGGAFWLIRGAGGDVPAQAGIIDPAAAVHGQATTAGADAAGPTVQYAMTVHKSPTCACCGKWVDHLDAHGFTTEIENAADVNPVKDRLGVPVALRSCHTGVAEGYVFEGHIPADVIQRFLEERPEGAVGLAVPGMPVGSPGMEVPLRQPERYDVYLFDADGNTRVYASR